MALGWAVMTGAKDVATARLVQTFHPILFSFLMGMISFIGYGLLNLGRTKGLWQKFLDCRQTVLKLCISTLVIWVTAVFGLKYLEPAVASVVALGVTPLTTTTLSGWLRPQAARRSSDWISSIGIVSGVCFLVFHALKGSGGLGEQPLFLTLIGFGCAMATGFFIALSMYFSKDLYDSGWRPVQVLFVRIWLVIPALSLYVFWAIDPLAPAYWSHENLVIVIALGIFGTILPTYLSQTSLSHLEPLTYSKVLCLLPIFAMLFQYLDGRIKFSGGTLAGTLIVLLFIIYGAHKKAEVS